MRTTRISILQIGIVLSVLLASQDNCNIWTDARKAPSRSSLSASLSASASAPHGGGSGSRSRSRNRNTKPSRYDDEDSEEELFDPLADEAADFEQEEDEEQEAFDEEEDDDDEEEEIIGSPPKRRQKPKDDSTNSRRRQQPPPSQQQRGGGRGGGRGGPPPRTGPRNTPHSSRRQPPPNDTKPFKGRRQNNANKNPRQQPPPHKRQQLQQKQQQKQKQPPQPAFTRGISSFQKIRESTTRFSSTLYRDMKGLTSSELEQVMLKATRPTDDAVKGKHMERLVSLTYQVHSAQYDIYKPLLRKLYAKLCERDWRTKLKAAYILHRFSADGSPIHRNPLKRTFYTLSRTPTKDSKHRRRQQQQQRQRQQQRKNSKNNSKNSGRKDGKVYLFDAEQIRNGDETVSDVFFVYIGIVWMVIRTWVIFSTHSFSLFWRSLCTYVIPSRFLSCWFCFIQEANTQYFDFLMRYWSYVSLRTQVFGGVFAEIGMEPRPPRPNPKAQSKQQSQQQLQSKPQPQQQQLLPITQTSLRKEHLRAAQMVLHAGLDATMRDGEESENTATCMERVASDLIGLTTAVAVALNRGLKANDDDSNTGNTQQQQQQTPYDPVLMKEWCEFYQNELLPKSRAMVKRTARKLDAYGLFLPSRMGMTVAPELLEKGLRGSEPEEEEEVEEEDEIVDEAEEEQEEEEEEEEAGVVEEGEKEEGTGEEEEGEWEEEYEWEEEDEYVEEED